MSVKLEISRRLQSPGGYSLGFPEKLVEFRMKRVGAGIESPRIESEEDFYDYVKELEDYDKEQFVAVYVDTRNRVLGTHIVSIGTVNASLVHPREVFKPAFFLNAASVLIAHNHPSGDPEPSDADIEMTEQLAEAGRTIGIELLDHLIIGDKIYKSLSYVI